MILIGYIKPQKRRDINVISSDVTTELPTLGKNSVVTSGIDDQQGGEYEQFKP